MSRTRIMVIGGTIAIGCIAAVVIARVRSDSRPAVRQPPFAADSRELRLMFSGDTQGWIVPCGCTSNQSGGLLRRGTLIADRRRTTDMLYMDVGGAPGGDSAYEVVRLAAILRGELALGVVAHNLGGPEIRLGPDVIRQLTEESHMPFVSANAHTADGRPLAPSHRLVTAGARNLLIIGVLSPEYATPQVSIGDPQAAVLAVLKELKLPVDVVIVLAYLPESELWTFARNLPEADLVVGGPTGQSIPPAKAGPVWLAAATNKGKFLVEFVASGASSADGWTGSVVELTREFADDPEQAANLRAFREDLERLDMPASESGLARYLAPGTPDGYRVAGSHACRDCHPRETESWHDSRHAHAWDSLAKDQSHFDPYCQQCHTTGFGLPGGFVSAKRSVDRSGVGCESCHGPSLAHVGDPTVHTPFPAADGCTTCHDPENSPEFDYAAYWPQIEHGQTNSPAAGLQEPPHAP